MANQSAYPPTVQPGIPKLKIVPEGWTQSSLKNYLIEVKDKVKLEDDKEYDLVTVKRARGGLVRREHLLGKNISVKSQFLLKEGYFLISKRQIVHGACGIVPKELDGSIVSNEYSILDSNGKICLEFLKYHSHSVFFQQTCFHSSIGVHIEKMIFKLDQWFKFKFNLPPLPEQKKIAKILGTWDKAIDKLDKLIDNSKTTKKALMQQLLTGKKRLPGFTDEWRKIRLAECANSHDNRRIPLNSSEREKRKGDIPYWGANGIQGYVDDFIFDETIVLLAEDGGNFSEFSTRPIANISYGKSWVNNHAHILMAKENTTNEWIYYSLVHKNILGYVNGGTRAKLNKGDMLKIPMFLPSITEQKKLTEIFVVQDKEINSLESQRNKLIIEKKALMQQLLTGKKRVQEEA
ncbi:restriction modification system DNA specificity domain [Lentisphaera araneosa HTCC2155]|uniref:Restriction modification system DNA specificity domain n=1 Tax=Lentisphaera araneosa HTCC2155 TaxID=313628 RepID=A6DSC5_9BACT|nr:restriction endonuclease subunit S [Lentisphaera araneosa]EDM25470.1 restriction modification system DNA specificity domain [Lentisphaera araneosa HTCC2155]